MGTRPTCRHCGARPANRPKCLCYPCYHTPGVREATPAKNKRGRRGVPDRVGLSPLPPGPTAAAPGSAAKLAVMESRAAAGYELHHPGDARG